MKRDYVAMTFGQDSVNMHDDCLDGSYDEVRIAQEVFYGDGADFSGNSCAVAGPAIFASEQNNMVALSVCSHNENSAVINHASSMVLCQKEADAVESGAQNSMEGAIIGARIDHDVQAKRLKLSVNELSNFKPYLDKAAASSVPVKQVVSEMYHPTPQFACQVLMCHVVESSTEGMRSSCYLLKQCSGSDTQGNLGDGNTINGSLTGSDGSEVKQVEGNKSIASPISQESSVTKLLVSSPSAAVVTKPGPLPHAKRRRKRDSSVEHEDDVLLTTDSMKDSRALLRSRVFDMLKRAGWSTERRDRGGGKYRYIYRSPEGKLLREFRLVWHIFGKSLCAHGTYAVAEDDKQWTDVGHFWSDLYDTLRYIENNLDDWEPRHALAHQWSLLNPFVTVVLIDRKLHALRAGNIVKVNQSNVFDEGRKVEVNGRLKSMNGCGKTSVEGHGVGTVCNCSVVSNSAVLHAGGLSKEGLQAPKSRSIYVSEGSSLRLVTTINKIEDHSLGTCIDENMHICSSHLPSYVSDSTCLQYSSGLHDVPIGDADVNMLRGPETLSLHQESCMSSPSCNKQNAGHNNHMAKGLAGNSLEGGLLPLNVDSGVKLAKKIDTNSERLSEVELSKLCQAETNMLLINGVNSELELVEIKNSSMEHAENIESFNKFSAGLFEHQCGLKWSRCRKSEDGRYHKNCCLKEHNSSNDPDYASPHAQNDFVESQSCRKGVRSKKPVSKKRKSAACQLKDDDLLISAIIKKRSTKSRKNQCGGGSGKFKLKPLKKRKSQKGSCRLLLRNVGKGGKHFTERWSLIGERTVLSWLISVGAIFINETIQYRDPKDDVVVKDGVIMRDGILCNCCSKVFSVSGFKIHAGFKQNRPCLNLFMGSGRPYTLCQLQAWSAEYKARRNSNRSVPVDEFDKNDDSCGLCGDGGELLCCDNCPSTFHQSCLSAEELPEGSWYCLNCTCRLCGDLVNDKEASSSNIALKCAQCEKKYHQGCLIDKDMGRVGGSPWFCGIGCEEVYGGLQSRIGFPNLLDDSYSWTLLRCIHDDQKVPSPQRFALKAECNSKLAVAVTIMEECFLSMTDPRTGIDMIPQAVYNWGSEFARLDYHGFYTAVLEKDDVLISVASIRLHGAAVAEMPLIATCSKFRRQGMCRRLLNSIEKMLISLKIEKLVIAAISDLVETWTIGFGFTPMEEDEKRSLSKINLMVFPGTVMLKKTLYVNQGTAIQEGSLNVSTLEKGKLFDIADCLEGKTVRVAIHGNSLLNSLENFDGELKVALICPDMEEDDAQKCSKTTAAAGLESELSNSLGSSECEDKDTNMEGLTKLEELSEHSDMQIEPDKETDKAGETTNSKVISGRNCETAKQIDLRNSAHGSESKVDDNLNLLVIGNQNDHLQVIDDRAVVETVQSLEFPTIRDNPNCKAGTVTGEQPESMDHFSSQITEECLDELASITKGARVEASCDVAILVESRVMETEAISELRNCAQDQTGESDCIIEANNVSGTMTQLVNKNEKAAECAEMGPKLYYHLKQQGSLDSVCSLRKQSSDQCFGHNVATVVATGEVSGSEIQCVNHNENQLSLIEQSQEASVLPTS